MAIIIKENKLKLLRGYAKIFSLNGCINNNTAFVKCTPVLKSSSEKLKVLQKQALERSPSRRTKYLKFLKQEFMI